MAAVMHFAFFTLLLGVQSALSIPTNETTRACTEIRETLPNKVLTPGLLNIEYAQETQQYWSTTLRELTPACIVQPDSAADVSAIVKILNKYPSVHFATRSGGHSPNVGHATAQDGVLIAMEDLAGAKYDAEEKVAYVKPGGEWNDVIGELEKSGVTISGGRLGEDVLALPLEQRKTDLSKDWWVSVDCFYKVASLSLVLKRASPLMYVVFPPPWPRRQANEYQNIIGWETVMANSSIINVSASSHPDLAQAMRGSGSQFGIVTQFKVKVHPIGQVWGGFCTYSQLQEKKLYSILHDFVGHGAKDPKAAIIFSDLVLGGGTKQKIIFYFYDGPTRPTTGPFADFFKVPSLACLPRKQKYSDLVC
jgi:hypothetical protein